jgi:hypothetical protein
MDELARGHCLDDPSVSVVSDEPKASIAEPASDVIGIACDRGPCIAVCNLWVREMSDIFAHVL